MNARKHNFPVMSFSLMLIISFCTSCLELSELGEKPLVMATAATYQETSQSPPLLKFTIVYWADDISGLEINIYEPDGDLTKTWQQPDGILSSGDPVVLDGLAVIYGDWRLTFSGTIETNNSKKGKSFEDETVVKVTE